MGKSGKKVVGFEAESNVIYVTSRHDLPNRVRHQIWHTREEFIDMVMRNMDEVEEELQEQMELQARIADLRNNPPTLPLRSKAQQDKDSNATLKSNSNANTNSLTKPLEAEPTDALSRQRS